MERASTKRFADRDRTYGAIEAGGTKWRCAIGDGQGGLLHTAKYPTASPLETIGRAAEFFAEHAPVDALGIGAFGPVDLRPNSSTYGYITTTPKPGWAYTDVLGPLQAALKISAVIDTDVNASAFGEWRRGAGRGLDSAFYITVGTGIGGGAVMHGRPLHGLMHPEFGHIRIPHDLTRDPFVGACPYHKDCLEGLASGHAIRLRWGRPGEVITDLAAWELEAEYLAYAVANLVLTLAPEKVIIGGGVMDNPVLLALVRRHAGDILAGYLELPELTKDEGSLEGYIVRPALGSDSALVGALELAREADLLDASAAAPSAPSRHFGVQS